ncbi:hypothetical protein SCALM49S_08102 [Streptomyces californicus]
MLSGLISVFLLVIEVLWVANQFIAPTSSPPCRKRSTVIAGSIASGKAARSAAGLRSNAARERLTLALVRVPVPRLMVPGFRSWCASATESVMPSTIAR